MNGYDFDKTIYDGDSFLHFYWFCLKKFPFLVLVLPLQGVLVLFSLFSRHRLKQSFAFYLRFVPNTQHQVQLFWQTNMHRIKAWYLSQKQPTDVIISASPVFLLKPICASLGVHTLIATQMDDKTGRITGRNCYGDQKVIALMQTLGSVQLDTFYSDSASDLPIMCYAKKAYFVLGEQIIPYNEVCK